MNTVDSLQGLVSCGWAYSIRQHSKFIHDSWIQPVEARERGRSKIDVSHNGGEFDFVFSFAVFLSAE